MKTTLLRIASRPKFARLLGSLALVVPTHFLHAGPTPVGTAFTYQGQLKQSGTNVNATADFQFSLWDAANGAAQIGATQSINGLTLSNGLFTADLDFGAGAFGANARWLEIAVRSPAGNGAFTTLSPRKRLQPTPIAQYALSAPGISLPYQGADTLNAYPFQITASADDASAIMGNAPNGTGIEGNGNKGVAGYGSTGVAGNGNFIGVYGSGPTAIYGESSALGVHGILLQSNGGSGVKGEVNGSIGTTNGVYGLNPTPSGRGVLGQATASTGFGFGGLFESYSPDGRGVVGQATAGSGITYGVYGRSLSPEGIGVYGEASADTATGANHGVLGRSFSTKGYGVAGYVAAATGLTIGAAGAGVYGQSDTPGNSRGVYGRVTSPTGTNWAIYGEAFNSNNFAGYFAGRVHCSNLGVNTTNPSFTLEVNGTAGKPGGGSWSVSSDARLKKDIQPLEGSLDQLLSLRGVRFHYIDPQAINELAGLRIGMIAQEVEQVFPDWIEQKSDGYKALTYRGFEALTVEALRELRAEKDAEIAQLRAEKDAENAELRARIEALERMMQQHIANQTGVKQ